MTKKNSSNGSSNKTVTLKRSVAIKAIVTDKFKEYMNFEIQTAIRTSNQRIREIESRLSDLRSSTGDATSFTQQLEGELYQVQNSLKELDQRSENIKGLSLGSHFMQGLIDGFVQVKVGDNLYEKLGGLEVLVEDGVVKTVSTIKAGDLSGVKSS